MHPIGGHHDLPSPERRSDALDRLVVMLAGPVVTSLILFLAFDVPAGQACLAALPLLAGALLPTYRHAWNTLLPLVRRLVLLRGPLIGFVILVALGRAGVLNDIHVRHALIAVAGGAAASWVAERMLRRVLPVSRPIRVAVIGSPRTAESLQRELTIAGNTGHRVVGSISPVPLPALGPASDVPVLGSLEQVGSVVERHGIDLLLMTSEAPRMAVFEEMARSCLHLPVRLRELASFYEATFGHVAVAEINAAWFQYLLHPNYRPEESIASRVLDLVIATLCGIAAAPLLLVFAAIIRLDGGPAIFRQIRVGESGRPFTIYKLRTMRLNSGSEWSSALDERVTGIGRFLRRTHLDELPQVWNVLKGDMSIVGPRPEQPAFVDQLEQIIPFYQRRHLIKPGVTGWAQVRCGYAGSEVGSAWKVCHDLYYLKNRSFALNVGILIETFRTLVADPQYTAEPASVDFILAPVALQAEAASA